MCCRSNLIVHTNEANDTHADASTSVANSHVVSGPTNSVVNVKCMSSSSAKRKMTNDACSSDCRDRLPACLSALWK